MSVIVTTYNQSDQSIVTTLKSIVNQDFDNFEIVIADDCSETNQREMMETFLRNVGFTDYKILVNEANVGTVKNIHNALEIAEGQYIKNIGPGDMLYSDSTLKSIYMFCLENDVKLAFGKIKTFTCNNDGIAVGAFNAPTDPQQYVGTQDRQEILKQMLVKSDWIPGGSLIFNRTYLLPYLSILADDYHVRYCEDLVSTLVLFDDRIEFFDEYIYWYEWGVGISSSGKTSSRRKMYDDHSNFFSELKQRLNNSDIIRSAYKLFLIKRFVMLYTPISTILNKYKTAQYLNNSNRQNDGDIKGQEFLCGILSLHQP